MILGQPIYRFLNLRAEVAEILARYERDNAAILGGMPESGLALRAQARLSGV